MAIGRTRNRDDDDTDINITPMLDVVFIMLIFFIVTATFIKQPGKDILRPEADTANSKPLVSVLVAVTAQDEIWIDKNKVDEVSIRAHIEKLHSENPRGGVVVQGDKNGSWGKSKSVLDAAKSLGVTDVAIATEN